jgi:hypothetical protein
MLRTLLKRDGLNAVEMDVLVAIRRWATDPSLSQHIVCEAGGFPLNTLLAFRFVDMDTLLKDCVKFQFICSHHLWHRVWPTGILTYHQLRMMMRKRALLRAAKG